LNLRYSKCLVVLCILAKAISLPAVSTAAESKVITEAKTLFVLATECPPGFELMENNACEFRNLYRLYSSLQNAGVGGLKTNLPEIREGFSPQQIDLGRYLFFDPVLSSDQSVSCASCHHPKTGFSDAAGRSMGFNGERLARSAPSLWNVGFLSSLFWDGRASSLEQQMQGPLYNQYEMANTEAELLQRLNAVPLYVELFAQAFPEAPAGISLSALYTALAGFESSLISLNSRYDQYAHGYHAALNDDEKEGMNVFRSFVARCAECHTPPLFTNQQIAVLGTPEAAGQPFDAGREAVTNVPENRGGFKVPSLRNISKTAPYMHSGRFESLRDTVQFYTNGRGHAVPEEEQGKLTLHWHIWDPKLSDHELDRLVDFLLTLDDESFTPRIPDVLPSGLPIIGRLPEILNPEVTLNENR